MKSKAIFLAGATVLLWYFLPDTHHPISKLKLHPPTKESDIEEIIMALHVPKIEVYHFHEYGIVQDLINSYLPPHDYPSEPSIANHDRNIIEKN